MSFAKIFAGLFFVAASLGNAAPSLASDAQREVSVQMNMARILRLPSPASTVVVGNPVIADATIQDPQTLVLTGNGYGTTNLIALDAVGNPIADLLVHVSAEHDNVVTVFQGTNKESVACAPTCQPMALGGDSSDFTNEVVSSLGAAASVGKNN